ncbi:hypothetical protein AOLI_G00199170 [Acnodon oligacanthus]
MGGLSGTFFFSTLQPTHEEGIEPTTWVQELPELSQRDGAQEFPSLRATTADGRWQEKRVTLLTSFSLSLGLFKEAEGKVRYVESGKVRNLRALFAWAAKRSEYSLVRKEDGVLPVPKRLGDLWWWIIHGTVATNQNTLLREWMWAVPSAPDPRLLNI